MLFETTGGGVRFKTVTGEKSPHYFGYKAETPVLIIGSLSNDDGDGNENATKQ